MSSSVFNRKPHMFPVKKLQGFQYVVIKTQGSSDQHNIYFAQAPILGIKIEQAVDFNMVKTLNGNFGLLTFQDHPVVIGISGLRNMAQNVCSSSFDSQGTKDVSQLYAQYKSSLKKDTNSILLTIAIGGTTYKGVIMALSQTSSQGAFPGLLNYNLKILGARAVGTK